MPRINQTSQMLLMIIKTPMREWIEFPLEEFEDPTRIEHRVRVKLSRIREEVRKKGKQPADFTLGCRYDSETHKLRFIRVDSVGELNEMSRRTEMADLVDLMTKSGAREILDDV